MSEKKEDSLFIVKTANEWINEASKTPTPTNYNGWQVSDNGDLEYLPEGYFINGDRLTESLWITHMQAKKWVNLNDFIPAYLQACRNKGIQFLNVRTFFQQET